MNIKMTKISLYLNLIIVFFTIIACIIMFSGFQFMEAEPILESTRLGMFKFFTVDSNILMGISSLVFAIKEVKLLKGTIKDIPVKIYILKLLATVAVTITFLTVFGYLGRIADGGIYSMLTNSNLFFHLLIPVLSMITFVFFEKANRLRFIHTFWGIIPTLIYSVFYSINVLIHIENGKVSPIYDWYWFVQGGLWQIGVVLPLMLVMSYITSLVLWWFNKSKN